MLKRILFTIFIISSLFLFIQADEFDLFADEEEVVDSISADSMQMNQPQQVYPNQYLLNRNSSDFIKGVEDAKRDAQGSTLFCFSGGCFGIVGIFLPHIIDYNPPIEKIAGKSPDYVIGYSFQYSASMKNKNTINAIIGCVSSFLLLIGFIYII